MKMTMVLIGIALSTITYSQKPIPKVVDSSIVRGSIYEDIRYPERIIEMRYVVVYIDSKGKLLDTISTARKFFMSNFRIGVDTPMVDRLFDGTGNETLSKPGRMDFKFYGYHEVSREEVVRELVIGEERRRTRRIYNSSGGSSSRR
jgi:hypothetical protein